MIDLKNKKILITGATGGIGNGLVKKFYIHNTELILPHERLEARNFVLHPLKEISPNWTHPKTKKNIDILIHNLKDANNEITKLV